MATKNYMINDKWLDLDKQNIVELQSVDGELDSLKVNGSEIVTPSGKITITENGTDIDVAQYALADVNVEGGGGGGSSDLSTAVMTVISSSNGLFGYLNLDPNSPFYAYGAEAYARSDIPSQTIGVLLYQGFGLLDTYGAALTIGSVSGSIEYDSELEAYKITGDCTITIS